MPKLTSTVLSTIEVEEEVLVLSKMEGSREVVEEEEEKELVLVLILVGPALELIDEILD